MNSNMIKSDQSNEAIKFDSCIQTHKTIKCFRWLQSSDVMIFGPSLIHIECIQSVLEPMIDMQGEPNKMVRKYKTFKPLSLILGGHLYSIQSVHVTTKKFSTVRAINSGIEWS